MGVPPGTLRFLGDDCVKIFAQKRICLRGPGKPGMVIVERCLFYLKMLFLLDYTLTYALRFG